MPRRKDMGEYEKGPQNMDLDTENAEGLTETDASRK